MANLTIAGIEYWVGSHSRLGIMLHAKHWQDALPPDHVRLFVLSEARMGTFAKGATRELVSESPLLEVSSNVQARIEDTVRRIERVAVDLTRDLSLRLTEAEDVAEHATKRVTNCYFCKSDLNSWDFSLCQDCGWILCSCAACGCGWES